MYTETNTGIVSHDCLMRGDAEEDTFGIFGDWQMKFVFPRVTSCSTNQFPPISDSLFCSIFTY